MFSRILGFGPDMPGMCPVTGQHSPKPAAKPAKQPALNPAALRLADAAAVLSRVGGTPITTDMLEADLEAGAPANPDGTINLVHYTAWLVKAMNEPAGARDGD